ncbi:MAG: hypothetical protein SFU99_18585 [Saprospiraceae bacterium]|nr:hypothetical protein [Saprospiraceae bacterium]
MKVLGSRKWGMGSRKSEMGSRKQYRIGLLTLGFALVLMTATAQIAGKSIPELRQEMSASVSILPIFYPSTIPSFHYSKTPLFQHSNIPFSIYYLPLNPNAFKPLNLSPDKPTNPYPNLHRYEHLPIFCKIEVKMEQAAKFPIKVRLGDVEYVDRLEGKRQ